MVCMWCDAQAFEYHLFGDMDALSLARSVNLDQWINLGKLNQMRARVPACLPACLPAYLPVCHASRPAMPIRACVPACLLAIIPAGPA